MSDMAAGQLWGYGISVAAGACSGVLGSLFWFISKLFRNSARWRGYAILHFG